MRLSIHKETPATVPSTRLMRLFKMVADAEAPRNQGNVNLVFTTDAVIRRLNRQFRGIDRTTDVLSFHLDEPDDTDHTFGEIYISVAMAVRQAAEYGHGRYEEYLRLACHGFLHLFGYDHIEPAQQEKMALKEEFYLARLHGVG